MNYGITYSLRLAFESNLPEITKAQIISQDTDWSALEKPFMTIQYYDQTPEEVAAGRESYRDLYYFQVGVFARDISELHRLETKVRKVIREKYGHPLYLFDDETGQFYDSGELIPFEDDGFTPMENDDTSAITYDHHGYFDVSVEII